MSDNDTGSKRLAFVLVSLFGGIGGLAHWLWPVAAGETFTFSLGAMAANVFLGMVAGLVGTYVSKVDSSRLLYHSVALALLFGLFWQPSLEGMRGIVITGDQERQVAEQVEAVRQSIDSLDEVSSETAGAYIEGLEAVSRELMRSKELVRDSRLRAEIDQVVVDSVEALGRAAEMAPEAGARALGSMGAEAMKMDRPAISRTAAGFLVRLAEEKGFEVGTSSEVSNSLLRLSAAARASQQEGAAADLREQSREIFLQAEKQVIEDQPELRKELRRRSIVTSEMPLRVP